MDNLPVFWIMTAAMALFTAYSAYVGRIRIRGHDYADRTVGPKWFWFAIALLSVVVVALTYQAAYPPY